MAVWISFNKFKRWHISYNTPFMHPIVSSFPPLFWISFVFHFSWRICSVNIRSVPSPPEEKMGFERHHCEESGLLYCNLKKRQNSKWWHVSFLLNWPHSLVQIPSAIKFLGSIIFLRETKTSLQREVVLLQKGVLLLQENLYMLWIFLAQSKLVL